MNNTLKNGTYWALTLAALTGALIISVVKWTSFVAIGTIYANSEGTKGVTDIVFLFVVLITVFPIAAGLLTDFIENKGIRIGGKAISSAHVLIAGLIITLAGACIEALADKNEGTLVVATVVVAIGASLVQVNATGLTGRMYKKGKTLPAFFIQDTFINIIMILTGSVYEPALYSSYEQLAYVPIVAVVIASILFIIVVRNKLALCVYDARAIEKEEIANNTGRNIITTLLFAVAAFAVVKIADMSTFMATTSIVSDFPDGLIASWPKNPVFIAAASAAIFGIVFALISKVGERIKPGMFIIIAALAEAFVFACMLFAVRKGGGGSVVPAAYFLTTGIIYAAVRPALKSFIVNHAPGKLYTTFCALPHMIDYIGVSIATTVWAYFGGYLDVSKDCLTYIIAALIIAVLIIAAGFITKRRASETK